MSKTSPTPEELAKASFGERAAFYTTSAIHADPQVLARVVELAAPQPAWRVLDIATGSGHTAFAVAPRVRTVIAVDLTAQMVVEAHGLRATRGLTNVELALADVHHLPFANGAFDLITCRRAAHHFSSIAAAVDEMRRVLRPAGRLVIDDRSVPEDDFVDWCMNTLDTYHDPSHVREYRPSEWQRLLQQGGFAIESVNGYVLHRPISALSGDVPPDRAVKIDSLLRGLDAAQRSAMGLVEVEGDPHLNHWYVMVAAVKR